MIKKTIAVIGVAALAASAVALPQAVAAAPNSGPMIQLATYHGVSPCAAQPCQPCSPCAAEQPCSPCAAEQPCQPCAAQPCQPCAANPCAANPCGAN